MMNTKYLQLLQLLLIFLVLTLFISCEKDKPNPENNIIPNATHRGIVITNEGSYGNNNGELSFLDLETKTMFNQLYQTANSKSLGDIVQCAVLMNGKYYVSINNSNKIVVINAVTYKEVSTINSVKSPRYITQVSSNKAYITSLYFPSIYVLDLNSNSITKTISVNFSNTERMLVKGESCYVTNWDTSSNVIYRINTLADTITNSISFEGRASHGIVMDNSGMIWILSGNKYKSKISHLTRFNPLSDQIIKTYSFKLSEDPFRLTINSKGDSLYYINIDYSGTSSFNGLYKMSINDINLPDNPFIQANSNSYFWALGIDSITNHIFLSDPKGFTQKSTIYEYSNAGVLLNQYTGGIGSNGFLFK